MKYWVKISFGPSDDQTKKRRKVGVYLMEGQNFRLKGVLSLRKAGALMSFAVYHCKSDEELERVARNEYGFESIPRG